MNQEQKVIKNPVVQDIFKRKNPLRFHNILSPEKKHRKTQSESNCINFSFGKGYQEIKDGNFADQFLFKTDGDCKTNTENVIFTTQK
jgi:hypothetical protein